MSSSVALSREQALETYDANVAQFLERQARQNTLIASINRLRRQLGIEGEFTGMPMGTSPSNTQVQTGVSSGATGNTGTRPRKKMSAAQRKKISLAQKARHATATQEQPQQQTGQGGQKPKVVGKGRRASRAKQNAGAAA